MWRRVAYDSGRTRAVVVWEQRVLTPVGIAREGRARWMAVLRIWWIAGRPKVDWDWVKQIGCGPTVDWDWGCVDWGRPTVDWRWAEKLAAGRLSGGNCLAVLINHQLTTSVGL